MKKQIMKRAWEIAREAAGQFGRKVKPFFIKSLKQAWREARNPNPEINETMAARIVGRIELDYFHKMSASDFCRVYGCPRFMVGLKSELYYIPSASIAAIKSFFPENTINFLEKGAKCSIKEKFNGWIVSFREVKSISEYDTTEFSRV